MVVKVYLVFILLRWYLPPKLTIFIKRHKSIWSAAPWRKDAASLFGGLTPEVEAQHFNCAVKPAHSPKVAAYKKIYQFTTETKQPPFTCSEGEGKISTNICG